MMKTKLVISTERIVVIMRPTYCSNGLLDPWSAGGVKTRLSESLVAILIPDGAHHLDLRGSNPSDPPSVLEARQKEKAIVQSWIEKYRGVS